MPLDGVASILALAARTASALNCSALSFARSASSIHHHHGQPESYSRPPKANASVETCWRMFGSLIR